MVPEQDSTDIVRTMEKGEQVSESKLIVKLLAATMLNRALICWVLFELTDSLVVSVLLFVMIVVSALSALYLNGM